ncbi:MAG TPA: energy transducer TonB [Blastocatellia bacterium]
MASTTARQHIDVGNDGRFLIFTSIESGSLLVRLGRQLSDAASEFSRSPAGFVIDSFKSNSADQKRKRLMYAGAATATCVYAALLALFLVMGFRHGFAPPRPEDDGLEVRFLSPNDFAPRPQDKATGANGLGGVHAVRGSGGGGGGGQNDPRPPSKGVEPQMLPIPQVVAPKLNDVHPPTLPFPVTIVGPKEAAPPPGPLGLSKGVEEPPSPGPGTGGGLGAGKGTGAGNGNGAGAGPGNGAGRRGQGGPGLPNSHFDGTMGPVDWRLVNNKPGFHKFEWIYRQRPVITPEAAAEGADGDVLLRATFHADGTITDIDVVNPVAHMTQAAIEALKHCKFRPATFNGEPVTLTHVLVIINVTTGVSAR